MEDEMIVPTIGRVVWFRTSEAKQPYAAVITFVWSDSLVNLCVFHPNGNAMARTSIHLHQEGEEYPSGDYAEWMPYQIGQAAKTQEIQDAQQALKPRQGMQT